MKKLIAVLLAALMLFTILPLSVFAASGTVTFVNATRSYEQVDHIPYNEDRTDGQPPYASVLDSNGNTMRVAAFRFVAAYDQGFLVGYNADPDTAGENLDNNRLPRNNAAGGLIYTKITSSTGIYNPYLVYLFSQHDHDYKQYKYGNEYEAGAGRYLPLYIDGKGNCDTADLLGTTTSFTPGSSADPAYVKNGDGTKVNNYGGKNYYSFGVIVGEGFQEQRLFVIANYGGSDHYLKPNASGVYSVPTNKGNVTIRVDEAELYKKSFLIALPSGDGFSVQPYNKNDPTDPNYHAAVYNGDFSFKLVLKEGYSDANTVVTIQRANSGAEISTINEVLAADGIDRNGNKIYTIHNITTNIKIGVSLVIAEKSDNIFTWIKRIIRLLLNLFGISVENDFTKTYSITVNNNAASSGVEYEFISGVLASHSKDRVVNVLSNSQVVIKVTVEQSLVTSPTDSLITVTWTPGNEDGSAITDNWQMNSGAEDSTFYKLYCISGINADTVVTIVGP